jgi:hypothetical protein
MNLSMRAKRIKLNYYTLFGHPATINITEVEKAFYFQALQIFSFLVSINNDFIHLPLKNETSGSNIILPLW